MSLFFWVLWLLSSIAAALPRLSSIAAALPRLFAILVTRPDVIFNILDIVFRSIFFYIVFGAIILAIS
jgi:hypothetical protein